MISGNERFITQGRMQDTVPKSRFVIQAWHIFVIITGTCLVGFLVVAIVILTTERSTARVAPDTSASVSGEMSRKSSNIQSISGDVSRRSDTIARLPTSFSDFGIATSGSDVGDRRQSEAEAGPAMKEFGRAIVREFREADSVCLWLVWLIVRIFVLLMMLVIAYLGFVSFLFFSLLAIISFIVALFTNTFCWSSESALPDRIVQILMFFYLIPFFELVISLNITVISAFFSKLWDNLNLLAITAAIEVHGKGNSKLVVGWRYSWDFFYFATLGFLFIFCISFPDWNIPTHLAPTFSLVCLLVPLFALVRPIIVAWHVLLFDRDNLELPDIEETDDLEQVEQADNDNLDGFDVEEEAPLTGFAKFEKMTHSEQLVLYDPVGTLRDDTWITFLRSAVTARNRPQKSNSKTFVPAIVMFVLLDLLAGLDVIRMNQNRQQLDRDFDLKNFALQGIIDSYDLGWEAIERPWLRRINTDIAGLVIRILLVIVLFPFNTLSHHGILFMTRHFKVLGRHHSSIRTAKLFGLLLIVISIVAIVFGAIARVVYPQYTAQTIVYGLKSGWVCLNSSEPLYTDHHALCGQTVATWPLIQLAALPILAETGGSNTEFPQVRDFLQCLTNMRLIDDEIPFSSEAILAYNREEGKLALGLTSIPFDANFAIYCENFLSSYYPEVLVIIVPFFSLAYSNILSSMLTTTSQVLVSGILGPNRLSTYYLDEAIITSRWELNTAYSVFEALRLSTGRPVVVGHGANGLLAKALPFTYNPWRVSFESPVLKGSPIESLAREQALQSVSPTIINFYTEGSIYALMDNSAVINNRISSSDSSPIIPPNPFETFCMVAAACAQDDRFDQLCNDVLDGGFENVWNGVGRERVF
jgi:hypothetical protein